MFSLIQYVYVKLFLNIVFYGRNIYKFDTRDSQAWTHCRELCFQFVENKKKQNENNYLINSLSLICRNSNSTFPEFTEQCESLKDFFLYFFYYLFFLWIGSKGSFFCILFQQIQQMIHFRSFKLRVVEL